LRCISTATAAATMANRQISDARISGHEKHLWRVTSAPNLLPPNLLVGGMGGSGTTALLFAAVAVTYLLAVMSYQEALSRPPKPAAGEDTPVAEVAEVADVPPPVATDTSAVADEEVEEEEVDVEPTVAPLSAAHSQKNEASMLSSDGPAVR
jgi:hypothetical protein